jgi:hypothetical protein
MRTRGARRTRRPTTAAAAWDGALQEVPRKFEDVRGAMAQRRHHDFDAAQTIDQIQLGVLLGRDHGASPRTRDGSARAVEGARRFPGRRPCNATRPPGARSAPDPSPCPGAVWQARRRAGKCDPSRVCGTPAGDRDGPGALRDCGDGAGARRGPTRGGPPRDTSASNTRGRDHTTRRSRRVRYSVGRFSGEAACPRRRSGSALRLDTARKPWHKRDDRLGPSEHRGGHRGPGASTSRPSPQPAASPSAYSNPVTSKGRSAGPSWLQTM